MTTTYYALEIAIASLTLLGLLAALFRFFGKVDRNTEATKGLTDAMDKLSSSMHQKFDEFGHRIENHEVRITVLESTQSPGNRR